MAGHQPTPCHQHPEQDEAIGVGDFHGYRDRDAERDQRQPRGEWNVTDEHADGKEFDGTHRRPPDVQAVVRQQNDRTEQDGDQRRRVERVVRAAGVEDANMRVARAVGVERVTDVET